VVSDRDLAADRDRSVRVAAALRGGDVILCRDGLVCLFRIDVSGTGR
jgi:hypothetical protein